MTRDISPDIRYLQLCYTRPHGCSYLPNRQAVTSFVDPATPIGKTLYSQLSRQGFRRSGKFYYAPRCGYCKACVASRIVVDNFNYSRQFRRCLRRNSDISQQFVTDIDIHEHYPLYEQYINSRHSNGDMYPPSCEQFEEFLGNNCETTGYLEFRRQGKLMGCAVVDELDDGLSAIYTYFSPSESRRSPGTLAILRQVAYAKDKGLPYVYLGYWIKNCRKMAYKVQFSPLELFVNNHWVAYNSLPSE